MIRKWLKELFAPIVREVIAEDVKKAIQGFDLDGIKPTPQDIEAWKIHSDNVLRVEKTVKLTPLRRRKVTP